jgi:hypothetical protein
VVSPFSQRTAAALASLFVARAKVCGSVSMGRNWATMTSITLKSGKFGIPNFEPVQTSRDFLQRPFENACEDSRLCFELGMGTYMQWGF